MTEMPVSAARDRFADVVDRARMEREPVYLTRHGRRVAAVVDATVLAALVEDAEDLADIRAAAAARAEIVAGTAAVPWEQVKVDLGLV